ncbi:hypothetical protein B0H34DRAFT_260633 [Crassisporium funariophilum]|nr:hypothetical protein B0H34DRAFT_260633 [Crassisporium funariophilum]
MSNERRLLRSATPERLLIRIHGSPFNRKILKATCPLSTSLLNLHRDKDPVDLSGSSSVSSSCGHRDCTGGSTVTAVMLNFKSGDKNRAKKSIFHTEISISKPCLSSSSRSNNTLDDSRPVQLQNVADHGLFLDRFAIYDRQISPPHRWATSVSPILGLVNIESVEHGHRRRRRRCRRIPVFVPFSDIHRKLMETVTYILFTHTLSF